MLFKSQVFIAVYCDAVDSFVAVNYSMYESLAGILQGKLRTTSVMHSSWVANYVCLCVYFFLSKIQQLSGVFRTMILTNDRLFQVSMCLAYIAYTYHN